MTLTQINTPLFAYEPVLRGLQEYVRDLVDKLERTTHTNNPIAFDSAQTEAFICGLTQKVALIQGPPGGGIDMLLV